MIQNRYLVVQPIGKGGMGEVYLAVDQRLGSAVALKRTFFTDDSTLAAAFEREARILARLRHPVLPKVIDHFVENGDQYLVMEHISGDDLSKRLETAQKPFPLSWVMFWADQLLDALSYLHSHEPPIVHRDIKPQNLKLTDENHIVLLDFGLSKDFDTKATSNPLNSASVAGYSPHFASMEQIRGTGTDGRSDIYSLTATLYQMMTGVIPVDALSRADALLGNAQDPIKPLDELNPEVTPAISDVILKGVALRQDDRFGTAAEMQKALRRAFDRTKKETDDTVPVIAVAPDSSLMASPSDSQPSEMETRAFSDTAGISMDATLQMSTLPDVAELKQSDVKTEMYQGSEIGEVETKLASIPPVVEAHSQETQPPVAMAAGVGAAQAIPLTPTPAPAPAPQPVVAATQKTKGSSSKVGFMIGGLVGLLVLGGIAGGGGWYLYTRNNAVKPATSPSPGAQPSATVPGVADSNSNGNSNAATQDVTDATAGETNADRSTTNSGQTSTRSTPQATTKNQPAKTTQAPAAKATPKTKPKDDRTVIIQ